MRHMLIACNVFTGLRRVLLIVSDMMERYGEADNGDYCAFWVEDDNASDNA